MFNQDILLQVTSRLNNKSLEVLSHTSLWNDIREFASKPHFWKMRVENLVGVNLDPLQVENWKEIYYIILDSLSRENPFASELMSLESIRVLLEAGYDPTVEDNELLMNACQDDWGEVVVLLLSDTEVDPSDQDNKALKIAAESGSTEVVAILLGDSRVDPTSQAYYALGVSIEGLNEDIVELLLKDKRMKYTPYLAGLIREAIEFANSVGGEDTAELLEEWLEKHE